jgi:hypothetical protein
MVVEVLSELPVLIVDGAETMSADSPSFYLMQAFGGVGDKTRTSPVKAERVAASIPDRIVARVMILADVPELTAAQSSAIESYLQGGGSVLVLLGPRARRDAYNTELYRSGKGWLPCRVDDVASAEPSTTLDGARLLHPALAIFEKDGKNRLAELPFRRWRHVTVGEQSGASTPAVFTGGDPWLIEKSVGTGRVLVMTTPLDRSWDNGLASAWEFPVLAHELVYYLAGLGSDRFQPSPGQPVRVGPDLFFPPWSPSPPVAGVLHRPDGTTRPLLVHAWPGIVDAPGPAGTYRIALGDRPAFPVVVPDDANESDLTPMSDDDRRLLGERAGIQFGAEATSASGGDHDLWRICFILLIVFLCVESWLAGRMAR